ncbi:nucleotidyl transferase AbiEii/AbiGii toxin family protein [Cryobacterium sp. M23]|uniref:nucleotidyl transferase AbiEii/AbiGii toxin family protein n=1 Tax=Cryobacterium sp. M23 TaxID=2048292 RepID=UPI000CE3C41B|nr:nucleotidyl transferase AbiEii/AbiGii toxin family protein [Cryobacterium sp. M23]
MIVSDPYPDGRAVLSAIREKARAAHRSGVGSSVQSLIELAAFDRFLCRVFSQDGCPFALKGGTSMLARLPQSRSTTDVDLETAEMSIDAAIAQLASAASIDLGDHFEFRYVSHRDTGGPNQPELHAAAITFSVTVRGAGTRNPLRVDLAIHTRTPAAPLNILTPAFRLDMSRLGPAVAYQAIAVEDQIADKVCATLSTYGGQTSTRTKDLVDLAILTKTMRIDARQLRISVHTEAHQRGLPPFTALHVPRSMTDGYRKVAKTVPVLSDVLDHEAALSLVNAMLLPALSAEIEDGAWDPSQQQWIRPS